jgi:2-aminoadipate transaminase
MISCRAIIFSNMAGGLQAELPNLSREALSTKPSAIREILKLTQMPGIISFAGGLPEIKCLPTHIIPELHDKAVKEFGNGIFSYGLTEGFLPFREINKHYLKGLGVTVDDDINKVLIHDGSQQAIDLTARVLIDPGDYIVVEKPTYLGALQAFLPRQPRYLQVETDEMGLVTESLEEILSKNKVKMLYVVPNFQNPSGKTIPWDRRQKIAELAEKYNIFVLEDDPYGELRYEGEHIAPIQSLIPDRTLYTHTFSKILAPGLRLAAAVAPNYMADKMVEAKQGSDLSAGDYNQALATIYVRDGYLAKHLPIICATYKPRRDTMLYEMEIGFPPGWRWSHPEGGMFLWAEGPEGIDTKEVFRRAVEKKVAFVPGEGFFVEGGNNTMRLNFSFSDEEKIRTGIPRLAETLMESAVVFQRA